MSRALHLAYRQSEPDEYVNRARLLPPGRHAYAMNERLAADHMGLTRVLSLQAHLERFGARPSATGAGGEALLTHLEESGLGGHGGGHFPVARKWQTALRHGGGGLVVANGAESEPASAKDRALLATVPHLVLDGLACAAEAVGAADAVVWMHDDVPDAARAVAAAIAERQANGLSEISMRRVLTPPSYLSGESSAILRSLSGGPALPAFSRRPAAASGYRGRPTLVHNVETLARIGLLARTGSADHHPTALVTVSCREVRTVLELDQDASIGDAISHGGWTGPPPQAVLVGGYGGSWLPWSLAESMPLRHRALQAVGAGLGAGVLIPLAESECGIARTASISRFLANSGAQQCGPCRFGLPALADGMLALAEGRARRHQIDRLHELVTLVDGRGGCHHPDGAARLITTALQAFAADAADHAGGVPCRAV